MEKDLKTCFNPETKDFGQQTGCGAPVHWLKYTTVVGVTNDQLSLSREWPKNAFFVLCNRMVRTHNFCYILKHEVVSSFWLMTSSKTACLNSGGACLLRCRLVQWNICSWLQPVGVLTCPNKCSSQTRVLFTLQQHTDCNKPKHWSELVLC